jgi:sialate O-acetylesterase
MKTQLLFGAFLLILSLIFSGMPPGLAQNAFSPQSPPTSFLQPIFTSHMVLQRDAEDPVWGWTAPGTRVTVEVRNENDLSLQTKTAVAEQDGRWQVTVGPFAQVRGNKAYSIIITAHDQPTITLDNILIGDVWLCSGQSNMARSLITHNGIPDVLNQDAEIKDTQNFPQIRQYYVGNLAAATPQLIPTDIVSDKTGKSGPWLVNNPTNASAPSRYSAVAYFFARELTQNLGVPIGIIQMSWGGTSIQSWIDPTTLAADPDFASAVAKLPESKPNAGYPAAIYNGKVATITSFKMKGAIWYQGENNANAPQQYGTLLPLLLKSWRSNFGQPNWPFVIIQLPNFSDENWPIIREAQLDTVAKDPNSRLVVTIDLGDPKQLHPGDKQDVAHRAALAALNLAYGQNIVYSGPIFTKATIMGKIISCAFDQVGAGLMVGQHDIPPKQPLMPTAEVPDGTLVGFELAGADGHFFPADAKISGKDSVDVSCSSVSDPVAVRYAWAGAPTCNLYNKIEDRS